MHIKRNKNNLSLPRKYTVHMSCGFPHQEESKAIKSGEIAAKFKKRGGREEVRLEVTNWTVGDDGGTISKALFMGDESAVLSEIEVPM